MLEVMKNIDGKKVVDLKDEVTYAEGQVVSKTLAQGKAVSVTLFAFDANEEISSHSAGGDAFVTCLDGCGRITVDDDVFEIREGQSIVMPKGHPHALFALEQFKMMLVVIFPED